MGIEARGPERKGAGVLAALVARRDITKRQARTGFVRLGDADTGQQPVYVPGVDLARQPEPVGRAVRERAYVEPGKTRIETTRIPPSSLDNAVGDWPHVTIAGGDRRTAALALFSLIFPGLESDNKTSTWVLDLSREPAKPAQTEQQPTGSQEAVSISEFLTDQARRRHVQHDSRVVGASETLDVPAAKRDPKVRAEILATGLGAEQDMRGYRYELERLAEIVVHDPQQTEETTTGVAIWGGIAAPEPTDSLSRIRAGLAYLLDTSDPAADILSDREKDEIGRLEGSGDAQSLRKTSLSRLRIDLDAVYRTDQQQREAEQRQEASQRRAAVNPSTKKPMASEDGSNPTLRYHRTGGATTDTSFEGNMMLASATAQLAGVDDPTERVVIILDDTYEPDPQLMDRLNFSCMQQGRQLIVYRSQIALKQQDTAPMIRPWSAFVSLGISSLEAQAISPQFGLKKPGEYTQAGQARVGPDVLGDDVDEGRFIVATAQGTNRTGPILPMEYFSAFLPTTVGAADVGAPSTTKKEWKDQPGYRQLTPPEAHAYLDWKADQAIGGGTTK
jgi:hypothetical protein